MNVSKLKTELLKIRKSNQESNDKVQTGEISMTEWIQISSDNSKKYDNLDKTYGEEMVEDVYQMIRDEEEL